MKNVMLRLSSGGTSTLATSFFQVLANASGGAQPGESGRSFAIPLWATSTDTHQSNGCVRYHRVSDLPVSSLCKGPTSAGPVLPDLIFPGVSEYPDASWLGSIALRATVSKLCSPSSLPLASHSSPSHPVAQKYSSYAIEPRWCLTYAPSR